MKTAEELKKERALKPNPFTGEAPQAERDIEIIKPEQGNYKDAYYHIERAIIALNGYPTFTVIQEDLVILKNKMGDLIW